VHVFSYTYQWLVATYQIVSETPGVFNIAFPKTMAGFFAAISILDFNYSTLFQCGNNDYNFVSYKLPKLIYTHMIYST